MPSDRRLPPHNLEAENALIGAIFLWPDTLLDVLPLVVAADFYQPKAQATYDAMCQLHDRGVPIDVVTLRDQMHDLDLPWLLQCQNDTPSRSSIHHYANIIIEASRRRALIELSSEVQRRAYDTTNDVEEVIAEADPRYNQRVRPRSLGIPGLSPIDVWEETAQMAEEELPWLIPHIIKPRWRTILVAGEGVGKATFLRQLGLHAACGIDPFDPNKRIAPVRCLYIDCENSSSSILQQNRIANRNVDLVRLTEGRYYLWHREQGFNLRERVTRAELESVIQVAKPQIVFAGPLYKMGVRRTRIEDLEAVAGDFTEILDDLRVRYNFALVLEHHMPKQERGAMLVMEPFGSSLWKRWPETGVGMNDHGQAKETPGGGYLEVDVEFFRPPRDIAEWPVRLERGKPGQSLAWSPTFANSRGRDVGAKWVDGEWTYQPPVKPGEQDATVLR